MAVLLAALMGSGDVAAQELAGSLPGHYPLNPMSISRTGLYPQPYLTPAPGWSYGFSLEYGSAVEWEQSTLGALYVLDAELMRVKVTARRDISASRFFLVGVDVNGVFNGFADGAFDWYHTQIGISVRGREQRPSNQFGYSLLLPGSVNVQRERPDYFLGDVQLGYGIRHSPRHQTTFSTTVPTGTAPAGYTKDTWSFAGIHSVRVLRAGRLSVDATAGLGYTPVEGELAPHQTTFFNSSSVAASFRLFGRNVLYGHLFTHSPLYENTTLPELDNREWTGDFGWIGRTSAGREWRLGFTEDFGPSDAGIDLILRFSTNW